MNDMEEEYQNGVLQLQEIGEAEQDDESRMVSMECSKEGLDSMLSDMEDQKN